MCSGNVYTHRCMRIIQRSVRVESVRPLVFRGTTILVLVVQLNVAVVVVVECKSEETPESYKYTYVYSILGLDKPRRTNFLICPSIVCLSEQQLHPYGYARINLITPTLTVRLTEGSVPNFRFIYVLRYWLKNYKMIISNCKWHVTEIIISPFLTVIKEPQNNLGIFYTTRRKGNGSDLF